MASSDSFDTWAFRPIFPDSFISEAYVRDTETLTKALQKSLYNTSVGLDNSKSFSETLTSDSINPLLNLIPSLDTTLPPTTPTSSNFSGSDPDAAPSKRHKTNNTSVVGPSGKVSKRKSRATKRTQTTFITADAANFRQMVQQVTGVRFGNSQVAVVKPEPQRASNRLLQGSGEGCLPTLDTSAFLLDHHHHHQQVLSSGNRPVVGPQPMGLTHGVGPDASLFEFDTFSSFPTLESWKVM